MKPEIEVKFFVDHDDMRQKLEKLGAKLVHPMRLMRRVIIDAPGEAIGGRWIRVRDEGDKVTLTYKQFEGETLDGVKEIETTVGDFETAVDILKAIGLTHRSYQESKREEWGLDGAEVVLDEWPWLNPCVEIEAKDEATVKDIAAKLGLDWEDAIFGSYAFAYRAQYPHLSKDGDPVGDNPEVKFGAPLPEMFKP